MNINTIKSNTATFPSTFPYIGFTPDKLGAALQMWINEQSIVSTVTGKVTSLNSIAPTSLVLAATQNTSTYPNLVAAADQGRAGVANVSQNADASVFQSLRSAVSPAGMALDYNTPFSIFGSLIYNAVPSFGVFGTCASVTGQAGWLLSHHQKYGANANPLAFMLISNFTNNNLWIIESSIPLVQGELVNYVLTYDGSGTTAGFSITINGVLDTAISRNAGAGVNASTPAATTGFISYPAAAGQFPPNDVLLESCIANVALSADQIAGAVSYLSSRWF